MYVWKVFQAFNFSSGVTVHKQNLGFDVTIQYRFGVAGEKTKALKQRFTSAYVL